MQTLSRLDGLVESRCHGSERLIEFVRVVHHAGPQGADHRRRHVEQFTERLCAALVHRRELRAELVNQSRGVFEIAVFVSRGDAYHLPRLDACADASSRLCSRLTHTFEGAVHIGCIDAGQIGRISEPRHAGRRSTDGRGRVGQRVHLSGRADDRAKRAFDSRDAGQTGDHTLER